MVLPNVRSGFEHGFAKKLLVQEAPVPVDAGLQILDLGVCAGVLPQIEREHPSLRAATKGRVHQVVIENHDIARCGYQSDARHLALLDAPEFGHLTRIARPNRQNRAGACRESRATRRCHAPPDRGKTRF